MTKRLKKKAKPVEKPKRVYNNSTRQQKSQQTQKLILESFIDLLVERRGAEVKIEEIAKRCKISERTIFRFFRDKDALHAATHEQLARYLKEGYDKLQETNAIGFARYAFEAFDKYPNVVMAYIYSPYGREARSIFRRQFAKMLIDSMKSQLKNQDSPDLDKRLALIGTLINANIWNDLLNDFDMSGKESGEAVAWAINTLLEKLDQPPSI